LPSPPHHPLPLHTASGFFHLKALENVLERAEKPSEKE